MAKRRGTAGTARRKSAPPMAMPAYKPPSLRDRVKDHADMTARTVMEQHPLHKKMRADMQNAIMSVVKGSMGKGSARGRSAGPMPRARSVFS